MENRRGAVVALDPRNGEVLAMVSRPAFDPNLFAGRIRSKDWKELLDNPGSSAAESGHSGATGAGFDVQADHGAGGSGNAASSTTISASTARGGATFYGRYLQVLGQAWNGGRARRPGALLRHVFLQRRQPPGHRSHRRSTPKWSATATRPASICRTKPKAWCRPAKWKIRNFREKWYPGETISVAIGQGATTVTPLQMADGHRRNRRSEACGTNRTW